MVVAWESLSKLAILNCSFPISEASQLPGPAVNASQIHPWDIGVIGALGNSLTAAYLAHDNDDAVSWLPSNLKEYKGVSFVTGGDQNATTLANYLAFYYNHYHQLASPAGDDANVPLLGSSSGVKIVSKCISLNPIDLCPPQDWIFRRSDVDGLNAAISGAKFEQLSYELEYLLEEYNKLAKAYPERTSDTWKLISIIIGTNNACEEPCDQAFAGPRDQPSFFRDRLNEVLNKLENSQMAPKLIVVLGALLDISDMEKWIAETDTNSFCAGTEEARRDSCPCVFSDVGRQRLSLRISTYNEVMKNVTQSYHEQPDPKITVLYWPGLATLNVSSIPIDFVSPYDCYHPSQHGQAGLATLLWNYLFQPGFNASSSSATTYPFSPYCVSENDTLNVPNGV